MELITDTEKKQALMMASLFIGVGDKGTELGAIRNYLVKEDLIKFHKTRNLWLLTNYAVNLLRDLQIKTAARKPEETLDWMLQNPENFIR